MKRRGLLAVAALGLAALFLFSFRPSRLASPVATTPGTPVAVGQGIIAPTPALAWATARTNVSETRGALPPAQETLWNQPANEPALAIFMEWTRRYQQAATPEARAVLEAEGVLLATARRDVMVDLIQRDPQLALERAIPSAVRRALPDSVQALLEEPVNARGDLQVMGVLPGPDGLAGLPPVLRSALIAGESYEVFTSGAGLRFVTRDNVPFQGISLPASLAAPSAARTLLRPAKILALAGSPARRLDQADVDTLKQQRAQDPFCSISGQTASSQNDETVVQLGGDLHSFCGRVHAEDWAGAQIAALGLDLPGGTINLLTAKSSYTEGRKRMLCLRPYWANQAVALTTNAALTHWVNFSNYMFQMSYGKMAFAPLQKGSDISAEILMPGSVDDYTAGLGSIYTAIKEVARTNYGYNIGQYDFIYYCTGSRPAASYAGLGFVGGVGFHLANGYFDAATSSHEFGHNLALNHAHFWDTESQSIIGAGQNVEYGDGNDPMGGGGNPNQFNSRYKNYLGWITNSDIADLNLLGSGRYRLYSFDLDHSTVGTRGLKFRYNASQNYWLNFRQRKNTKALNNGVQLFWTDNGNGGSYLLDVRLRGGSSDNAIVVGRTFSDTNLNFHFTPVGKGNTYPESMDLVVFTGAQPGNLPPTATLGASSQQANPGEALTFTASATDPNGDALAYYWEFSDGADNYSIDNSPVQTKSFSAAGEYTVRCVVSDMRGGTAQHTLVVRVGSPATFRISGHAVDNKNRPLAGIRVAADASHYAFTDSDGSYTLVNLAAGGYSLSAIEPVAGAMTLVHPYFNNPLVVGPDFTTADFVGVPGTLTLYTPLAAKTSSGWKYHDKGVDQGTAWRATVFADAGWSNGVAPLGYPSGAPITTVVSYGPNANNKYPTYYFRKQFNVANPAAFTNLLLEVMRDDSAAVYLNGTEVFRDNLPAGTITYNTFAVDNSGASGYSQTTLPVSAIVAGMNTLAVEVHQVLPTSSDIVMDAALSGLSVSNVAGLNVVYLGSPADTQVFSSPTNVTLTAGVFSGSAVALVEFYADGAKIGEAAAAPFTIVWNSPADGGHLLRCVATIGSLLITSPPVNIVVAPPAAVATVATLIAPGAVWKYLSTNVGASVGWPTTAYDDSAWLSGPGKLGFGAAGVVTTIYGGPNNARYPAAYFRHAFVVEDPAGLTNLSLRLQRDDGAVVYLNGLEVARDNIQNGVVVTYVTLATNAADNGVSFFSYSLPVGALKHGTNLVAVEVHQSSATSSDLAFDLGLSAVVLTNRARGCWLVAPSEGATIPPLGSVTLQAEAVAGGALGLTRIEFFSDGVKIGEDTTSPFTFDWVNAPAGSHALTAIATDSDGATVSSAPVNITVLPPPLGSAFISLGDVWRYLDNGSNQGTNWAARNFDDRLWKSGPARLGYGGDGEITTVSFGTNAATKYITTYFRKAFTVASPATFSGLLLRLLRDDGAAVYLNGKEIFRNNLQPGLVSWNSLAVAAVDGAAETSVLETALPTTGLIAGTNVLAVEIHQASVNSSDLGFDLALIGLDDTNATTGLYLAAPAQGTHYNLPASVGLSSFAAAPAPVTLVEYYADAVKIAEAAAQPYLATWSNPAGGSHALTAVATYGAGLQITSAPVVISVGDAPAPITSVFVTLVPPSSGWKYWDSATAAGVGWEKPSFDDAAWPAASARFGWGLDGEITPLNETRVTHYFRRWFAVANLGQLSDLFFYLQRDDGAVVYLNGTEIYRQNMPAGPVSSSTLAAAAVNTPDETIWNETVLATAGSGLAASNLLAVELHQSGAASSDAAFDFALYGAGSTVRRIYLAAPASNAALNVSSPIALEAGAWAGTGRTVTNVEFYVDGLKIGESIAAPHRVVWSSLVLGQHVLRARMFDDTGVAQDSAPLPVNITRELVASTFIPAGAVWKFLDNGSNQGTNWAQPAFNDAAWSGGQARLGFGNDGEVLPALSGQPVITYYFRKTFVVPAGAVYTNLIFRLVRDDGAVVWLNGREAYRSNMGAGVIAYNTRPPATTGGTDEQTFFPTSLTVTNLPVGTNLVAVEVHQFDGTSSDAGFNLELVAAGYLENSSPPSTSVTLANGVVGISWPASFTGYQVYTAPDLNTPPASWTPSGLTPLLAGGRFSVTIAPTNSAQFYRLQK